MDQKRFIQKIINSKKYVYDKYLDIIFDNDISLNTPFNRIQTNGTVDLCIEITTFCNYKCINCFSCSSKVLKGRSLDYYKAFNLLKFIKNNILRVCITGGEPLIHPNIDKFLNLPKIYNDIGFLLNTNFSLRHELDHTLIDNSWIIAVSLHGIKKTHEKYTCSNNFIDVVKRIEKCSKYYIIHIYTVLHDSLDVRDIEWLYKFRNESGANFLRFSLPRNYGKFVKITNPAIISLVEERLDQNSALKLTSSNSFFFTVEGELR